MGHHCCSKQKVKRGLWSPEEDEKLIKCINTHGHACWSSVPKLAGLQRCGKSCRLRWINYLRPDLKRGSFSAQEERIIIDVHRILGNRWAQIAKHLPGRTDNEVKNFWNSCIKKKLIAQGLDPRTHNLLISSPPSNANACIHQHPNSSVFSMNMMNLSPRNTCMRLLPQPLPPPPPPPLLHESINYQENPNQQNAVVLQSCSTMMNPSRFGFSDEGMDCPLWVDHESFEEMQINPVLPPEQVLVDEQEKVFQVLENVQFDENNEVMNSNKEEQDYREINMSNNSSLNSSDFDFEFIDESAIMSCGMYSNNLMSASMDQIPWDC